MGLPLLFYKQKTEAVSMKQECVHGCSLSVIQAKIAAVQMRQGDFFTVAVRVVGSPSLKGARLSTSTDPPAYRFRLVKIMQEPSGHLPHRLLLPPVHGVNSRVHFYSPPCHERCGSIAWSNQAIARNATYASDLFSNIHKCLSSWVNEFTKPLCSKHHCLHCRMLNTPAAATRLEVHAAASIV